MQHLTWTNISVTHVVILMILRRVILSMELLREQHSKIFLMIGYAQCAELIRVCSSVVLITTTNIDYSKSTNLIIYEDKTAEGYLISIQPLILFHRHLHIILFVRHIPGLTQP